MSNKQHSDAKDAQITFLEGFKEAVESDRWAAVVWRVKEGRLELARVTTFQFPNGDMLTAVSQLADRFSAMQRTPVTPDPLPMGVLDNVFPELFQPSTQDGE